MSRYGKTDLVAVKVLPNSNLYYGFRNKLPDNLRTQLGQIDAQPDGQYINGLIIGTKYPRPPRVKKLVADGYQDKTRWRSSYCSIDQLDNALLNGWVKIKSPVNSKGKGSPLPLSRMVYVDLQVLDTQTGNPVGPSIKYAWRMPLELYDKTAVDRAALGVEDATVDDVDLVFGANFPKPPHATFVAVPMAGQGYISTRGTFVDFKKLDNLPDGWIVDDSGNY